MNTSTETIPCLQNTLNHARKHAESIAESIRYHEDEIRSSEVRLREANRLVDLAQAELDIALEQ